MLNLDSSSPKSSFISNAKMILMRIMVAISIATIVAATVLYFTSMAMFHNGTLIDSIFSFLFMFSIIFFGLHSIGFYLNAVRSIEKYPKMVESYTWAYSKNQVAVLVPAYNEPIDMFSMNLAAVVNATKDVGEVYVLDDSTKEEISTKVRDMCNHFKIQYIHRENRRGYKAGAINDILPTLKEEYVCVLDADQMPDPNFLKEVLPFLYRDPKLAMVQMPQHYTNLDASILSLASQAQQSIFYDVITEGKSSLGTLFSCGTNIVYRKAALLSVGGFDESSITEDLATTVNMHLKGWKTFYYNKKLVYGRAPTKLGEYFNQQARWALGTMSLLKKITRSVLQNKSFGFLYKFDYFLTSSWYLCGWAYLIQMILPISFLLFNIKPLALDSTSYVVVVLPYTIFTLATFLISIIKTGNPLKYVFYNLSMNIISFPITVGASIQAIRKKRTSFVTARTGNNVPWRQLWPQLSLIVLLTASIIKGILFGSDSWFYIVNIIGAAFHLIMLLPIFKLNTSPKSSTLDMKIFHSNEQASIK